MATSTKSKKKSQKKEENDPLMEFLAGVKGLSETMKKRVHRVLTTSGIVDPRGIKALSQKQLVALPGISENTAQLLLETLDKEQEGKIFLSLDEREELETIRKKIKTGSTALDNMLGGGIPTGTFVELYGAPQSGKTQLCYTLSVHCLLPEEFGGLNAGVLWLDTEGSFNSKRLKQILRFYEYSHNLAKPIDRSKFLVATTRTLAQIENALKESGKVIPTNNVKLIIIDSLIDPFRAEYGGLGELADRQKHLNRILHKLMRIAEAYDLAVVYTNQVMANPDPFASVMDKIQPTGGFVLGHASDIRLWLRRAPSKVRNEYDAQQARRAMITDCGWLPMNECYFSLGPFGVCDVDEEAKHRKLALELGEMIVEPVQDEEEAKVAFNTIEEGGK